MKKSKKVTFAIYFIAFVLPILGMMNCSGWNAGNMAVKFCTVDGNIFRGYANFYYGGLFISSFMIFMPVAIYAWVVLSFTKRISKIIDKSNQK